MFSLKLYEPSRLIDNSSGQIDLFPDLAVKTVYK